MTQLVLSIFPGIDLLGMAFEEEGFCIVRGPDLIFGGDIRRFHPPAGRFDGVIGGPPCQAFSDLGRLSRAAGQQTAANLIPEYERVVVEAQPTWFVMENVPEAPPPSVPGYGVVHRQVNNRWFGAEQRRERRFSFGARDSLAYYMAKGISAQDALLDNPTVAPTATANGTVWRNGKAWGDRSARRLAEMVRAQGLPDDFLDGAPFTLAGKCRVVGNGVPLPMGRAVARAVKRALGMEQAA